MQIYPFRQAISKNPQFAGPDCDFRGALGRDLSTLHGLHQICEPMIHARRMLGFDTFAGFPSVTALDGSTAVTEAANRPVKHHSTARNPDREGWRVWRWRHGNAPRADAA